MWFHFTKSFISQLLAMDASARVTMKDAAKCDKRCEWQNSANQENAERILRFQVTPESISVSGHLHCYAFKRATSCVVVWIAFLCVSEASAVDASNPVVVPTILKLPLSVSKNRSGWLGWNSTLATENHSGFYSCMKSEKATRWI